MDNLSGAVQSRTRVAMRSSFRAPDATREAARSGHGSPAKKNPALSTPGFRWFDGTGSAAGAGADHVGVEGVFGHLEPEVFLVAEGAQRVDQLLEVRILGGDLRIDLVRRLVGGVEDLLRERTQLSAGTHQAAQGGRVLGVVFGEHVHV